MNFNHRGDNYLENSDIERRFARSLFDLFNAFADAVDVCECFLNTSSQPSPVFEQRNAQRRIVDPHWYEHLLKESGT